MTIKELLSKSGIEYTKKDRQRIGEIVSKIAKEKSVPIGKKDEIIEVNDYPNEFISEMEQAIINYYSS